MINLEDGNLGETPEFTGPTWEKTENNFIDNNNNYIGEVSTKSGTKTIALTEKEFELIELLKMPRKKLQAVLLLVGELDLAELSCLKQSVEGKIDYQSSNSNPTSKPKRARKPMPL